MQTNDVFTVVDDISTSDVGLEITGLEESKTAESLEDITRRVTDDTLSTRLKSAKQLRKLLSASARQERNRVNLRKRTAKRRTAAKMAKASRKANR